MNIFETVGIGWIVFTAALGHVGLVLAAYKHYREMQRLARRGSIEEKRDLVEASKVREAIHG